jgi:penicillin-binding protein 1A
MNASFSSPASSLRWLWLTLAWLVGGLFCIAFGVIVGFELWAPKVVEEFHAVAASTPNNTLIYADSGELVAAIQGAEDRHWVPLAKINPYMQKAAVAIEDRRFFLHKGMDPVRLAGAIWADLKTLSYEQGGSTLTQQLVKLSLLSSERTVQRKVKELFMAMALEQQLPKLQILEAYLNRVYLGNGVYGVEKAAQVYFNKSAADLSLNEAAFLAALIKKPEGYLQAADDGSDSTALPLSKLEPLLRRQRLVLETLHRVGWISDEEFRASAKQPLTVLRPRAELSTAPYFVQQVLKELKELLAVSHISGRGYRVDTTLDLHRQQVAEELAARVARENKEAGQAALVALEPATGYVRALVGGVDYQRSQFNRATQAQRQPGSAFKPLLYATALEHGFTPTAVFYDEPVRFSWGQASGQFQRHVSLGVTLPGAPPGADPPGEPAAAPPVDGASPGAPAPLGEPEQVYAPHNFDGRYGLPALARGESESAPDRRMTLGRALELSSNVIAVQLLDQLGMSALAQQTRRWEIPIKTQNGLCVALGCSETTLLALTSAYGSFANGGLRVPPVFIKKVTNSNGDVLFQYVPYPPEPVLSPWTAFEMRKLLQGVIDRGTGTRARIGRPAGGKTGTNDGPRDTWFIGFTPELVAGVWIGNDNNRPMPSEQGGRTTARVWAEFMRAALPPGAPGRFPEPPETYVGMKICNLDGQVAQPDCPDADTYYFRESDIPPEAFATVATGQNPGAPAAAPEDAPVTVAPAMPSSFAQRLRDAFTPAPRNSPPE